MSGPLIIGQAVIVVTEVMPGEFSVRSFGTAEGSRDCRPACSRGRCDYCGGMTMHWPHCPRAPRAVAVEMLN